MVGSYLLGLYGMLLLDTSRIGMRGGYLILAYVSTHLLVNVAAYTIAGPGSDATFYSLLAVGLMAAVLGMLSQYFIVKPIARLRSCTEAWRELSKSYGISTQLVLIGGAALVMAVPRLRTVDDGLRTFLPIYLLSVVVALMHTRCAKFKETQQ